ncbi:DUF1330 domain-containing protein [Sphingobium sp. HBC34]|uniref:DUF1330 domain-containing protein n=1 Tax=Sphingobium cyanobacteriorum TaxID=3063954 RepID=A0ABT8ZFY5_9SPHN|nr:DUF1330 domain-containing protein [Sphingobium sp. HBC34]MDO7833445.1 DUF1330 domain-containing protein [Sphingobium sp. HBC34]
MTAHMIALIYADDFSWIPEYSAHVPQIVRKYGGDYNFTSGGPVEVVEGDLPVPSGVGTFDFPSREAIMNFLNAEEYQPFIELRNRHSKTQILIFDGKSA